MHPQENRIAANNYYVHKHTIYEVLQCIKTLSKQKITTIQKTEILKKAMQKSKTQRGFRRSTQQRTLNFRRRGERKKKASWVVGGSSLLF